MSGLGGKMAAEPGQQAAARPGKPEDPACKPEGQAAPSLPAILLPRLLRHLAAQA